MTDIQNKLRARVDAFVAEISDLIRQAAIEQVTTALGDESSGTRGGKKATKAPKLARAQKGAKRSPEQMEALLGAIVKAVTATPGSRADQLAGVLGAETRELALPIKKLLADKILAKKGARRGTTYTAKK